MFKELKNDLNIERINGNLEDWTKQGVLLINSALTFVKDEVKQKQAIKLWKCAIKSILKIISENNKVIFLLLGKKAEDVCEEINAYKIITSHPSPLGYTKGFRNSRIFSKINSKLRENGDKEIIWN
jgi:uracil-DNA glycosylase